MMNIWNLFKNKWYRILKKKEVIVVALIIIPIMITTAVLFASRDERKATVALVTTSNVESILENNKYEIEVMPNKPKTSNLLLGHYDYIVVEKSKGQFAVETVISNKTELEKVEKFFNDGPNSLSNAKENERGIGTKIIGFVVMILIMQAVAITLLYPEDRSLKTLRRIFTAPVTRLQYILTQGIFTFVCLYIPSFLAILMTKELFGVKIGFSLGMIAVLIGILTALSTAFALFISSVLKENISLTASGIALIASLLAGCLTSFSVNSDVLDVLLDIIPLRGFMTLSDGVEKGSGILDYEPQIIYLIIWTVIMGLVGSFIASRKMSRGMD